MKNFLYADAVVFVHNGQCAEREQLLKCIHQMGPALRVGDIAAGEQHLGRRFGIFRKELVVKEHQLALAHGGGGLAARYVRRTCRKPQFAYAHSDGAGGYQHYLYAGIGNVGQRFYQPSKTAEIDVAGGVSQGGGSHFDHQPADRFFCHSSCFLCLLQD